jgi:hypothetical protein
MKKETKTFIKIDDWGEMELGYLVDTVKQLKSKGTWILKKWERTPSLDEKNGGSSRQYVGQNYDPEYFNLIPDGWTHDHCEICTKTISDTVDWDTQGYNLDNDWICEECFNLFMVTDDIENGRDKFQRVEK